MPDFPGSKLPICPWIHRIFPFTPFWLSVGSLDLKNQQKRWENCIFDEFQATPWCMSLSFSVILDQIIKNQSNHTLEKFIASLWFPETKQFSCIYSIASFHNQFECYLDQHHACNGKGSQSLSTCFELHEHFSEEWTNMHKEKRDENFSLKFQMHIMIFCKSQQILPYSVLL